jgi:hypothetical protein
MCPLARLSIAAILWSLAAPAHAGSISSGPVVGFFGNGQDTCYVRNAGTRPVEVTAAITGEDGTAFPLSFQNCNDEPLAPSSTCLVVAERPAGFSACTATTKGSAKALRATLETRVELNVVSAQDLAAAGGGGTLTSPAIFGGADADLAFCAVRNVGKKPTSPVLTIVDEAGSALDLSSKVCGGVALTAVEECVLEPGQILSIHAVIAPGAAYACSAKGKARSLRGAFHTGCCNEGLPSQSYRSSELR